MTRVNAGIKPEELCNSMLFAEYREIKRIPNKVKAGKYNPKSKIPEFFKLGTGHEFFFKDKLKYLSNRNGLLYRECIKRGMNVTDYSDCYKDLPDYLFNDWVGTKTARELLKQRINSRLEKTKDSIKFYNVVVTYQKALIK